MEIVQQQRKQKVKRAKEEEKIVINIFSRFYIREM